MISPVEWLGVGRHWLAERLREAASALDGLANWLDAPEPRRGASPRLEVAVTRKRIAATLERARRSYDGTSAGPRGAR
jgi:hypothetical protein